MRYAHRPPTMPACWWAAFGSLFALAAFAQNGVGIARARPVGRMPAASSATPSLFAYLRTVQVTPDGVDLGGGFVRIYDSPTPGRLLVTFNTQVAQPEAGCSASSQSSTIPAHVYKEYTADLEDTGARGVIACVGGDIGSLLVGTSYYLVNMQPVGGAPAGWHVARYDALTWAMDAEYSCALDFSDPDNPTELPGDQMVAFVNGQIDVSSQYNATHTVPDLVTGAATHHRVFTPELQFVGKKILADTPHICGSSMIFLDGVYYFVSADAFFGDVIVMKYDAAWNYLGAKTLVQQAHWSTGLAFDGQRFYVTYMDTSMRTPPNSLPVNLNVRLAAFDRDWDLIEDVPVTSFTWTDLRQPGRPYLLLHGSRLYVSYDCDTIDPDTHEEERKGQAYVAEYEITPPPPRPIRTHLTRTLVNDFTPCVGPASGQTTTPGAGRALIAHSTNGLDFQRPANPTDGILVDRAGVTDAVVLPSGRILVYFVDGCRPYDGTQPGRSAVAVAASDRQGAPGSWVFKNVRFVNVPTDQGFGFSIVDPNVVVLPNGELRLFATMFRPVGGSTQNGAYSFSSTDGGFTYSFEGLRYDDILDPENYRFSDSNWQIFTGGPKGHAISTDGGNTFTSLGWFQSAGFQGVVHEIAATDNPGAYRAYLTTPNGITSFYSAAAPWATWTEEPGYRLQVDSSTGLESCEISFPTVVKLGPSNYLMVYLTVFPGCGCGEDPTCP